MEFLCYNNPMSIFDIFRKKKKYHVEVPGYPHEYCPRCEANLTLQKGYDNSLPYWICKGCGEMLINPDIDDDGNIAWICDECRAMLNIQPGFKDNDGEWKCTECGFVNKIDPSEIYKYDDEYRATLSNPYRGMNDEDVLKLMAYTGDSPVAGRDDVFIVRDDMGKQFVKKILRRYDLSIFRYLKDHPIEYMPKIYEVCEGENTLVVIEEYINGPTLREIMDNELIETDKAAGIARDITGILKNLHSQQPPIIHRDVKPSNIIISEVGDVYLLDVNVAKWQREENEDTRLLGTLYYAAPEQFGYGMKASTEKADVYAVGIILNEMITGQMPKEIMAQGPAGDIVRKCISLEPENRYTDTELLEALNNVGE